MGSGSGASRGPSRGAAMAGPGWGQRNIKQMVKTMRRANKREARKRKLCVTSSRPASRAGRTLRRPGARRMGRSGCPPPPPAAPWLEQRDDYLMRMCLLLKKKCMLVCCLLCVRVCWFDGLSNRMIVPATSSSTSQIARYYHHCDLTLYYTSVITHVAQTVFSSPQAAQALGLLHACVRARCPRDPRDRNH